MDLKIAFLGTGCSAPTKHRNLTGITLSFKGNNYLFDCPEGAQQNMLKVGLSSLKIDAVFFSHFHADHFLGLPGLLATMNMFERERELKIFGPRGIKGMVKKALDLALLTPGYRIKCIELKKGKVLKKDDFYIKAFPLEHDVPCYGFVFKERDKLGKFLRKKALSLGVPIGPKFSKLQEGKSVKVKGKTIKPEQVLNLKKGRKGRKIGIVLDTLPEKKYVKHIENADVLIHEAVFLDSEAKRAKKTFHSTALQAAKTAKKAKVKKLYLTHYSNRYRNSKLFEREARKEFKKSIASQDLMKVKIKMNKLGEIK